MAPIRAVIILPIFFALAAGACTKPDYEDVFNSETSDSGLFAPNIDIPSGETGEEPDPVFLPPGECIQKPVPYVYGYVHQCEGNITVNFVGQAGGSIYEGEDAIVFGPGKSNPEYWLEDDSYGNPLVAACCGPFDYVNPTTQQKIPYVNNCLFDAVQQICHALPYLVRKQAEEAGEIEKIALNSLAGTIEDKSSECLTALWGDGPPGPDGVQVNELNGTTWSPNNNVTFEIAETEVIDWTQEGEVSWRMCRGMFDNDDAVIPTAPILVPNTGGITSYALGPGTTVTGSGPLSSSGIITPSTATSSLTLAYDPAMELRVTGLRLDAGPSRVSVNGEDLIVDRASVILRNVLEPSINGGEHSVAAGAAQFVTTTAFEAGTRAVNMSNDDPIVFRYVPTTASWEFDPFDLSYAEPGIGTWTLSLDGLSF